MTVDWLAQWKEHAPGFDGGYSHIDLASYGRPGVIRLQPGGGFGDTSHPTTRLVLRLMGSHVQSRTIVDIGCGSGILSLAALKWGAAAAIGIDLEEDALEHARSNCMLNNLPHATFTHELPVIEGEILIAMNMISSEQRIAWSHCPSLHRVSCPIFISGILFSERESYLKEATGMRGWKLIEERQEEEWLAFHFQQEDN